MLQHSPLLRTILLTILVVALSSIGLVYRLNHHQQPKTIASDTASPTHFTPGHIPQAGQLLLATVSGSGNHTTKAFTTSSNWNVYWNFACREAGASHDTFGFQAIDGSGEASQLLSHNADESGFGTETYHRLGKYQVRIVANPSCNWQVTVKAIS